VGRVSASRVVEVAQAIGVPELVRMARAQGDGPPGPNSTTVMLCTRPASILLPNSRVVFALCPGCGHVAAHSSGYRADWLVGSAIAYLSKVSATGIGQARSSMRCMPGGVYSQAAQGPRAAAIELGFGGWRELTTRRKLGWSAGNSDGAPVCARSAIHSGEFDEPAGTWEADPDADVLLTPVGV
jgi:hypothetical protein